ncbi:BRO family protein [Pseudomonas sp. p21]|uniref:BRO-N domain-containing protein n=1 Tax=Pseudomonas sp. p21 TaxID=1825979 RepID=UPI0015604C4C|nr:BRO family protein [Pseudomonas sp. p21]
MGHPEHDLLFVATQVAAAAGLGNPKAAVHNNRQWRKAGCQVMALVQETDTSLPLDSKGRRMRNTTVMFSESEVYTMLLSGRAPQSEPFRRWVTEEVLPTIRKTGQYNAAESSDPIAVGVL